MKYYIMDMKKLVLLCLVLIALAQKGLFAQEFVRPVHLDTVSKVFTFDGKKYMLLDGMWMKTEEAEKANLLWDEKYLPLDNSEITKAVEKELLEQHQALKTELKWVRTEDKYILSENLPERVKDTVLRCSDSILLTVFGGDSVPFRIIINDTLLVGEFNKERNILDKDKLGLETLEFDKNKNEASVSRIQIVPQGRVSSFVKSIVFDYKENRCETYVPMEKENKGLNWIWIVVAVAAVLLIAAAVFFFLKKRKKNAEFAHSEAEKNRNRKFQDEIDDKKFIESFIETKLDECYYEDERQGYLTRQIESCLRNGILYEIAKDYLLGKFGLDSNAKLADEEVIKMLSNYYKEHRDDFGKARENTLSKSKHDEESREKYGNQGNKEKVFEDPKKEPAVEEKIKEAVEKEKEKKQREIDGLEADNKKLSDDLQKAKQETEGRVSKAREEERAKLQKKIAGLEADNEKLSYDLQKAKQETKQRVSEAREEEREKSEKTIANLNSKKDELDKQLSSTKKELKDTKASLDDYTERYNQDEKTIDRLKGEQKEYTDHISVVKFASDYSRDVNELLKIADKVVKAGESLTKLDVDDPYLIYKALGVFAIAQTSFDYQGLMVEAGMAAKCQMTFSDSGIANLKTVDSAHQIDSLRNHFLARYLESYINALVVCNESLAGIDGLVGGISKKDTADFARFRDEILACCKRLRICVISVKLFDQIGENMDLKVRMVDYNSDIPSESIIAIDNCLVYPEGGNRPRYKKIN